MKGPLGPSVYFLDVKKKNDIVLMGSLLGSILTYL